MQKNSDLNMVDIILPTYNGEKYLDEQLRSIIRQTFQDFHLIIRDDGSSDRTVQIVEKYRNRFPDKITVLYDEAGNLGISNNVMTALKYSKAPYIMLSDQDDVWRPWKVEALLHEIQEKERKYSDKPILIASDSVVVDDTLCMIAPSFMAYSGLDIMRLRFSNLLQKNIIQGSSCIFNRKLLLKALKGYPITGMYHDAWLGLVGSAFGRVFFCNKKLMLYRQHSRNAVGAQPKKGMLLKWLLFGEGEKEVFFKYYLYVNRSTCKKFLACYRKTLSIEKIRILEYYIDNPNDIGKFMRVGLFRDYSFMEIWLRYLIGTI